MKKVKIAAAGAALLGLAPLPATAVAHADWPDCQSNGDGTHAYCHDSSGRLYEIYCNPTTCQTED